MPAGSITSDEAETMSRSVASMEMSEIDKNKERFSKLERIRRKLRDRDARLSMLVKENSSSLLAGTAHPYDGHSAVTEDDSKEALRVLSYAAFKLQRQVDKKADEIRSLHDTIDELKEALEEKEKEKSTLNIDVNLFRKSLEAHSDHIERLSEELDTKNKAMSALQIENDHQKQQVEKWKGKLDASRKDYEWMRKESMSKNEQIEYFEFELLSRNDEIDNLHREFDEKLRRIVELEVDMELMDARISRSPEQEGPDPSAPTSRARAASIGEFSPVSKRGAFSRLRELKCQKVEDTEALAASILKSFSGDCSASGSFPTDGSSTDTTVILSSTTSTDSTPTRTRRRASRRYAKGAPDHYIDIIDNLRSDLQAMEAKYKQDRYDSGKLIERLKQENSEYLIKLVCMDCKMRRNDEQTPSIALFLEAGNVETSDASLFEASVESGETPVSNLLRTKSVRSGGSRLPDQIEYLKQRVDTLEGERLVLQREIDDLKAKLSETMKIARSREKADKRTIDELVFQKEAQAVKISELERSRFSRSSSEDQVILPEYTASLESKIQKQATDMEKLQLQSDLKDRAIEALRAQLVDKRVRQISV